MNVRGGCFPHVHFHLSSSGLAEDSYQGCHAGGCINPVRTKPTFGRQYCTLQLRMVQQKLGIDRNGTGSKKGRQKAGIWQNEIC